MTSWRALPAATLLVLRLLGLVGKASAATISSSTATNPAPLVVPPSQLWDGNDGPWSSFFLQVGTPPQTVRALVSTANNQPLVVADQGCLSCDPPDCVDKRGGIFRTNTSSTWIQNNTTSNGILALAIETNLGLPANVQYGSDVVALGAAASRLPTISDPLVGAITSKNFFMGLFGLNAAPSSLSNYNDPIPSYISALKVQGIIPSLSYGYTAGNQYRFDKVFGSLALGGFDASLFEPNDLTIKFNDNSNFDLTVHVGRVSMSSNEGNISLNSVSFPAHVDSTVPYLYLPIDVCKKFEAAFQITYDTTSGLYLVNSTLHTKLLEQSANVTFTLTNSTGRTLVDIVLPYQAFDLKAKWPLVKNSSRYFPLKRAANNSQVTLGRAFLQEAYIIADYERSNFSLYQRKWVANAQPDIRTIYSLEATAKLAAQSKTSHHISIPAVVVGSIGGALFLTVLLSCISIRRRNKRLQALKDYRPTISSPIPNSPPSVITSFNDRVTTRSFIDRITARSFIDRITARSFNDRSTTRSTNDLISTRSSNDRISTRHFSDGISSRYTSEPDAEFKPKSPEFEILPLRVSSKKAKMAVEPRQVFELPAGEVHGDQLFGFVPWKSGTRG